MLSNSIDRDLFSTTYQETFPKVSVAVESIATTRFEGGLSYGSTVTRTRTSILGKVQQVSDRTDLTITAPTDTKETLTVNEEIAVAYSLTRKEMVQTGPLDPAEFLAMEAMMDTAAYVDGKVFGHVSSADTKVATVGGAVKAVAQATSSTPITASTSNINQIFTRARAGIRKNNVALTNVFLSIDPDNAAVIEEYMAGKDIDAAGDVFANGYGGRVFGADMFVSNNLTNEIVLTNTANVSADDTLTIGNVTFTFKASPSAAGEVDLGADAETSFSNLAAAINGGSGAGTDYIALSADDRQEIDNELRVTAASDATTLTITAKSGVLSYSESLSNVTETSNFMHVAYGQKGSVDLVIQDEVELDIRPESRQQTDNYIVSKLFGHQFFTDGKAKIADIHLSVA